MSGTFKLSSNLASLTVFLQTQMHATLLKLRRLSKHGELNVSFSGNMKDDMILYIVR